LSLGYVQRLVVLRRVKNPFEAQRVVGIHNYVDVAVEADVPSPGAAGAGASGRRRRRAPGLRAGVSWQLNKNALVKGKVDTGQGVAVCVAFRSWFQPIVTLGVTLGWDPRSGQGARVGVSLALCSHEELAEEHGGLTGTGTLATSAVYGSEHLGAERRAQLERPPPGKSTGTAFVGGNPRRKLLAGDDAEALAGKNMAPALTRGG